MKNKTQVLIVPINYMFNIGHGFIGTSLSTERSYILYDSVGVYKPLCEIENKICLIRISVFLLIKNKEDKYLVKELYDKSKKPYIELGVHSYVQSYSGNYRALYNQISYLKNNHFKSNDVNDFKFIGNIRDLANSSVQSILGCIYYAELNDFTYEENRVYEYKWYNKQELINRYGRATSWSKIIIDMIVDESIKEYI
jgi:predicted NUDIX family phosphoesterase